MKLLLVLLCLLLCTAASSADYQSHASLSDRVPGHHETFAQLIRMGATDLVPDPSSAGYFMGHNLRLRTLWGPPIEPPDSFRVEGVDYCWLTDAARRLLVLRFDAVETGAVLALYQWDQQPHLLDMAAVEVPDHLSFDGPTLLSVHPNHPAFMLDEWHDNSGESYDIPTVVGIEGDRICRLLQLPLAKGEVENYAPLLKHSETFDVQVSNRPTAGYRDLAITWHSKRVCHPDDGRWDWKTGIVDRQDISLTARWNPRTGTYFDPFEMWSAPRTAVGVVYYIESARMNTGRLHLYHDGRLQRLVIEDSRLASNFDLGSVVRIQYDSGWDGDRLLAIDPAGPPSPAVAGAMKTLSRYGSLLDAKKTLAAYGHLSLAWHQRQPYLEYGRHRPPLGDQYWKVIGHNAHEVLVLDRCMREKPFGTDCVRYTLRWEQGRWVIDAVDLFPLETWYQS